MYDQHLPARHRNDPWKVPCRVATTANITISTALNNGDSLDGVTLATGDRVLVKNQSTGSQNGIYVVGVTPIRALDYGTQGEILGSVIVVTEGTANADTMWLCSTNAPITVDTTALVFAAAGGSGAPTGADYLVGTAQAGLSAEIVVGASPGGELGGTWASPTVDATHAGTTHSAATDTHIADTSAAHAASAVAVTPTGGITSTDVQAALAELDGDISAGGIPATIVDAKGDLIAATAADTVARLAVGANDTILMADSAQSTGLKYVGSQTPSTQAFSDAAAEGTADTYARGDHKHGMMASPGGGGTGGDEVDYAEFTGVVSPTATTEATANTIVTGNAVAYSGSQIVEIEFFAYAVRPDNAASQRSLSLWLYDGSSSIGQLGFVRTPAAASMNLPVRVARRLTPSNATHTYSIRASVNAGTGEVAAGAGGAGNPMPGFIRITKV